ncbi:hypothetical protein [Komagataeibacter sp. FNDCF1]|uniref:hypothetical protein n=1 Tax=Komagataeibacter sp. FNDCF1 TaxID=2878681 RepID=UPI001E36C8CF|nr:hypothetical protein [Komagataeibacter sp. FNDCF1]MCE2564178.1 hypothetical protein [Komagataeibacter sp. FNDCF1]
MNHNRLVLFKNFRIGLLGACIDSFIESLKKYGETAKIYELNTKGNAWVSSFPTPNCSIKPIDPSGEDGDPDSLNGKTPLPTEENELTIDEDPSKFDFLGKGIDAGFRISKNSAVNTLTISPGLGILLCQAAASSRITKFNRKIHLSEMQTFKGVANNNPYPVLTIDTCREDNYENVLDMQRRLLGRPDHAPIHELELYLTAYLEYYGIEIPKIRDTHNDKTFSPPDFYEYYKIEWEKEFEQVKQQDRMIEDSSDKDNEETEESDILDPRKQELFKKIATITGQKIRT